MALVWLCPALGFPVTAFAVSYRDLDVSHEPHVLVLPGEPFLWIHLAVPGETTENFPTAICLMHFSYLTLNQKRFTF